MIEVDKGSMDCPFTLEPIEINASFLLVEIYLSTLKAT